MLWTEEAEGLLRELWFAGKASAAIAQALGNGCTENAVIGKAHRLGLGTTVLRLTDRSCRWPFGDPCEPSFHFCGRTKLEDFSYCRAHLQRGYQAGTSYVEMQRRRREQRRATH